MNKVELQNLAQYGYKLTPATLAVKITAHDPSQKQWVPARHLLYLSEIIATAVTKGNARLMITMPPRHGKSELLSVNTTTWFLEKYPEKYGMLLSYGAELATDFAFRVRSNFLNEGLHPYLSTRLNNRKLKIDRFLTTKGGGITAAGLGGTITGRGGDLILVDDYIKNAEEAVSPTLLQKTYEWFKSTCFTRLEPGGSIVILATRWSQQDLIGMLLEENPDMWTLINLPAVAQDPEDPMGREIGEALWPERYDEDTLEQIQNALGRFWWDAMYQQDPPASLSAQDIGDMITVMDPDEMPPRHELRTVRAWDLAASEYAKADYTAGAKMSYHKPSRTVIIEDMRRVQKGPKTVERLVGAMADIDGHGVKIWMEQEPGSAGKTVIAHYDTTVLRTFAFQGERATGPLEVRAIPFLASCEAGQVRMLEAPWNEAMVNEINGFPDGKNDDQVAALSLAFNKVAKDRSTLIWGEKDQDTLYKKYSAQMGAKRVGIAW